jgi:Protein of unknown function (DUF3732)
MKIHSIFIYSHDGRSRQILFNDGLSIITGRASTGKSALSDIIEYCMGRSTFNVPEGVIRDKVAWFGVIYQFDNEQILVAKPTPDVGHSSSSVAMLRRGMSLRPPDFSELSVNSDDDTVVATLSTQIGIPENRTNVPLEQSRRSYAATIKHSTYYLFQKQSIVTNKDQLFYRQNEQFIPQVIRDTLPILLGIVPDDRYESEARLRNLRRDLRLTEKLVQEAKDFADISFNRAVGLLSEAKEVGIVPASSGIVEKVDGLVDLLRSVAAWSPGKTSEQENDRISGIENTLLDLRHERQDLSQKLENVLQFSKKADGFSNEANEQRDRLTSIRLLPSNPVTGEWQWPFSEPNLGMSSPIAQILLREVESLDIEMRTVAGDRPKLEAYIEELRAAVRLINEKIKTSESELSSAIAANEAVAAMGSRNIAASKVVGRISLFLEGFRPNEDLTALETERTRLQRKIEQLESQIGDDEADDRLVSALNNISSIMTQYIREMDAEFSEFPFRLDLNHLTVVADRPERPIPMNKTGGATNHLAFHLSALLALHRFAYINDRPFPQFLVIDQPTQVYFPSERVYEEADGTIERTEADVDLAAARRLFELLLRFTTQDAPGFQIIVTEHANLRDQWFQDALVEDPWSKPPALVPEDWPDLSATD